MQTGWMRFLVLAAAVAVGVGATAADVYTLDPVHSVPVFKISHLGVSNSIGRFNEVAGTMMIDETDATKNSIEVVIKTASIDTGNEARDNHLKTADFLNVEKFPEMAFKSTSFEEIGENTYRVKGDLTLHGVTKPVEVEAKHIGTGKGREGETRIGWETMFTIKRSDYGMTNMVGPVGDDVEILFAIEAVKK